MVMIVTMAMTQTWIQDTFIQYTTEVLKSLSVSYVSPYVF